MRTQESFAMFIYAILLLAFLLIMVEPKADILNDEKQITHIEIKRLIVNLDKLEEAVGRHKLISKEIAAVLGKRK